MASLASHTALPGSSDTDHVEHHQGAQKYVLSANTLALAEQAVKQEKRERVLTTANTWSAYRSMAIFPSLEFNFSPVLAWRKRNWHFIS